MAGDSRPLLRLAILGPRGAGKTALAEALLRAGGTAGRGLGFDTPLRHVVVRAGGPQAFSEHLEGDLGRADGVLLLVDAVAGVADFHVRALTVLRQLALPAVAVALTKSDAVADARARVSEVAAALKLAFAAVGMEVPLVATSARTLAGIATSDPACGRRSLFAVLDRMPAEPRADGPLRLLLAVDGAGAEGVRWVAFVDSGRLRVGDEVLFSPANVTARVTELAQRVPAGALGEAVPGMAVAVTLDRSLRLQPGEIASHAAHPPLETDVFRCAVTWLGGELPLGPVTVALSGALHPVRLEVADLLRGANGSRPELIVRLPRLLALDPHAAKPCAGRAIFGQGDLLLGAGLIGMEDYPDQRGLATVRATNVGVELHRISQAARQSRNRHKGGVLWFTGLSGAGKSTLALETERRLFELGYLVYVLDGDNVRHGLCADLGFSPEDRAENIRRVGAVAALFADAGMIVLSAFISPYRSDRARARAAAPSAFHEVYVKASVAVCERRDPKGLYARARRGEVLNFTGISAPYEAPEAAELVADTAAHDVETSVEQILTYVRRHFLLANGA
ncbi:MAG: adenylyl-sulfate kinase [Alphaproteobacteria bacterium]|nr:adenylyl-sulfate kinase [Alphaproteobacteria bacterium]